MARASKSNVLKFKTKTKAENPKKAAPILRDGKKKSAKPAEVSAPVVAPTVTPSAVAPSAVTTAADVKPKTESKVSQKLLETIERRRKQSAASKGLFSKPPGRRGRRPKAAAEYVPGNSEEEASYVLESDNENIEYDTGIRVKQGGEERSFGGFERLEDFDEELNFDW